MLFGRTITVIGWCWLAFFVYWQLTAASVKQVRERQSPATALAYRISTWGGFLLLLLRVHGFGLGRMWWPGTLTSDQLGTAVCILGLAGAVWARRTLGGNWSSAVTLKEGHTLVRSGPYRWVRNPIYTSLLLMMLGTAIAIGQARGLVALALVAGGFWIKLRQEEAFMLRQFPDDYPAYRRQVKALIPFLL